MRKLISLRLLQTAFLGVLCTAIISLSSFKVETLNDEKDWTLVTTDLNIEVYGQIATCDQGEVYLFKLKNTSSINQRIEVVITIPNEPAYGPQTFVQDISANSETSGQCSESDLQLPKMMKGSDLSKVSVKLTSK